MDRATVKALVARNAKVAIRNKTLAGARDVVKVWVAGIEEIVVALLVNQVKAVVKVETGVMDKATAEVLAARNAKVAIKAKVLAEARDVVKV